MKNLGFDDPFEGFDFPPADYLSNFDYSGLEDDAVDDKRILIVGEAHEFLNTSVSAEMKRRGFDIVSCSADVNKIDANLHNTNVVLLLISSAEAIRQALVFLRDNAFDKRIKICLVGDKINIKEALGIISEDNVQRTFQRPVDAKTISNALEDLYAESKAVQERKSILVVDDDPVFLRRTQHIFNDLYKVFVVNSGSAALTLLAKHSVDLILLDFDMPVANGSVVYQMIKEQSDLADIPIMFLTGKSDIMTVTTASMLHPEAYILKTSPVTNLTDTVADFFKKQEQDALKERLFA